MKLAVLVALALVGIVAGQGNGAWKKDQEYKYKLVVRTSVATPLGNKQKGQISAIHLTIRPRTSNVLIAQITRARYGEANENDSMENDSNESKAYNEPEHQLRDSVDEKLKKPFEIHLRNGAIQSISVDDSLTTHQVNQLKYIVSQFQVDTKAERAMKREDNHLPDANTNNAFYVTMEPTVTGACETTYDISRMSEYMVNEKRHLVPKRELVADGHVIQIIKYKNYEKCNEKTRYVADLAGKKEEVSRIVITGTLNDYTIQSAVTGKKADGFNEYAYLSLESVERMSANDNDNSNKRLANLKFIYGLVPREEFQNKTRRMDGVERANRPNIQLARTSQSRSQLGNPEEAWSGCWTDFMSRENICKLEFSAEWDDVGGNCCGFLCLGHNALCRRSFPGCEATVCYSAFVSHESQCESSFGSRLPVPKGGFTDCAPGFWSTRCCPN